MRISGTLRFPPGDGPLETKRVHVSVRDITEFDAPAATLAELDLPDVHVPETGLDLPFEVDADLPDPARTYALRVYADRRVPAQWMWVTLSRRRHTSSARRTPTRWCSSFSCSAADSNQLSGRKHERMYP